MLLYIYRLPIWQTLLFLLLAAVFWVLMGGLLDSALPWGRRIWRSGCGVLAGVWLLAVLQATIFSRSPGAYEVCLAPGASGRKSRAAALSLDERSAVYSRRPFFG